MSGSISSMMGVTTSESRGDIDPLRQGLSFRATTRAALIQLDSRTTALENAPPVAAVPGPPGPPGPAGITGATINSAGHLILTQLDGTTVDAGYVQGPPGQNIKGDTGLGFSGATINAAGHLIVTRTDGSTIDAGAMPTSPVPAASANTIGGFKGNVTTFLRTTTPISVSVPVLSALGLSLLAPLVITVTGVQIGDAVQATFADAPPANLLIVGANVTAANTVAVSFMATGLLNLSAAARNFNFFWQR